MCVHVHIHTYVHIHVHEHQCVCTDVHHREHLLLPPFLSTIGSLGEVSVLQLKSKGCDQAIIKYESKKNESKKREGNEDNEKKMKIK